MNVNIHHRDRCTAIDRMILSGQTNIKIIIHRTHYLITLSTIEVIDALEIKIGENRITIT